MGDRRKGIFDRLKKIGEKFVKQVGIPVSSLAPLGAFFKGDEIKECSEALDRLTASLERIAAELDEYTEEQKKKVS